MQFLDKTINGGTSTGQKHNPKINMEKDTHHRKDSEQCKNDQNSTIGNSTKMRIESCDQTQPVRHHTMNGVKDKNRIGTPLPSGGRSKIHTSIHNTIPNTTPHQYFHGSKPLH